MRLIPLPGSARFVVLQTAPSQRLSFIIPAHTRKVIRFTGRGHSGNMRTVDFQVPDMMYCWEFDRQYGRFYVIERIDASGIWLRDFRIANVHPSGKICWGQNRPPTNPREMVAAFWGSNFNDDLTPYPAPTDDDWLESKEYKAWADANLGLEEYRTRLNSMREAYEQDRQALNQKFQEWCETCTNRSYPLENKKANYDVRLEYMNITLYYLEERGLSVTHIVHKIDCVQRISARYGNTISRMRAENDRIESAYNELATCGSNAGQTYYPAMRKPETFTRAMMNIARSYRVERTRSTFQKAIGATNMEMRAFFMWWTIEGFVTNSSDQTSVRQKFNEAWYLDIRERWWNGLWRTSGAVNNHKAYIFGTQHQILEGGCAGIVHCDDVHHDAIYFRDSARQDRVPHRAEQRHLLPYYRIEGRDDLMVTAYGDEPFVLTPAGKGWKMERWNEKQNEVQVALTEIFG